MALISVGWDVSKGYADSRWLRADGQGLRPGRRFEDTAAGQAALTQVLAECVRRDPEVQFEVALESTGGYERNWLHYFRTGPHADRTVVFRVAPLAVRRFREADLHHNTTDDQSAQALAEYLQSRHRQRLVPYAPDLEGERIFYRYTANLITRRVQVLNELHSLLPAVHPDLIRYCRRSCPEWLLRLLTLYPTAAALAATTPAHLLHQLQASLAAPPETDPTAPGLVDPLPTDLDLTEPDLAEHPATGALTPEGATALIAAAGQSVGSCQDLHTGYAVAALAREVLQQGAQIAHGKQQLGELLATDPLVRRLETIVGIGRWTAVVLRLEAGDLARFSSAAKLVAFAGLNPQYHESGDGKKRLGISKRGRPQIRAALYMCVLSAIQHHAAIRALYQRLRDRGKKPDVCLVACMAKLLRIAHACVVTRQDFDRERYAADTAPDRAPRTAPASTPADETPPAKATPAEPEGAPAPSAASPPRDPVSAARLAQEAAPVSRREAQRRQAAAPPPVGRAERERGRRATRPH